MSQEGSDAEDVSELFLSGVLPEEGSPPLLLQTPDIKLTPGSPHPGFSPLRGEPRPRSPHRGLFYARLWPAIIRMTGTYAIESVSQPLVAVGKEPCASACGKLFAHLSVRILFTPRLVWECSRAFLSRW